MKPALLTMSFLLFAFPLAFSNDVPQPVLDVDGDPVVPRRDYFGFTNLPGQPLPGTVTLGQPGNSTCPATVKVNYGLYPAYPLKFTPAGAGVNASVILTDTPLEIEFTRSCVESPKWGVFVDTDINQTYVGIGGPEDHPGHQAFSGTFRFLKSTSGYYYLAFCLPIVVDGSPLCWNITSYYLESPPGYLTSLLVLTNHGPGFHFYLRKPSSGIRTVV